jgi:hypothetical protein
MKKSVSSDGQPFESNTFSLSPKESILGSRAQGHGNGMSSVLSTLCCVEAPKPVEPAASLPPSLPYPLSFLSKVSLLLEQGHHQQISK